MQRTFRPLSSRGVAINHRAKQANEAINRSRLPHAAMLYGFQPRPDIIYPVIGESVVNANEPNAALRA